jgi:hypothetical protein
VDKRGCQPRECFRDGADRVAARCYLLLDHGGNGSAAPETSTIPIVFAIVSDPSGFIAGQSHPGGNITGFTNIEAPMGGKWLSLLGDRARPQTRPRSCSIPKPRPPAENIS